MLTGVNQEALLRGPAENWGWGNLKFLGSGVMKRVYESPFDQNQVIVMTRPHQGQQHFLTLARELHETNDRLARHFPKVTPLEIASDGSVRYASERLEPTFDAIWAPRHLSRSLGNVQGLDPSDPQYVSLNEALRLMDDYMEPLGWGSGRGYDLHSGNFMRRPPGPSAYYAGPLPPLRDAGDVVINDPVYSLPIGVVGGAGVLGALEKRRGGERRRRA